jgi:CheY-like chemotaxis protein
MAIYSPDWVGTKKKPKWLISCITNAEMWNKIAILFSYPQSTISLCLISYCIITFVPCKMISQTIDILLADDDYTDRLLFRDALEELPIATHLTTVEDGEQVIEVLSTKGRKLPDVLFLDLNMPRRNGFSSLSIIKRNIQLQDLPVVVFTTARDHDTVKHVFRDAAHYFIHKPGDFSHLKRVIYEAITLVTQKDNQMPLEENFVLTGASIVIPHKE